MHQIGSGVLGPVYRARLSDRDEPGERLFALKAFHVDLTPEQTIVFGDALQELVDLKLSHPALVSPVGAGVADGVPYLAYEYIAGESLDVQTRPRAPLVAEAAMPIVVRLAEALDAAHGRGLVHGALHLRDVLITADGARAGGFGIVAALDRVGHRCPLRPPYAAPEQIAGAEWGAAADRYALAAVSCELLTGRRPAGGGMAGHLERTLEGRAARRVTALFDAALAADPARRPQSAGRLARDLAGALAWIAPAGARPSRSGADGDGTKEPGGGRRPDRAEGDPAIAAGGDRPLEAEPVAAVGGTVMRKRRKRTPWRKQPEVDWTERALNLGLPDEHSGSESRDGRGEDAAARERAPGAGGDPIDAALERDGAPDGEWPDADLEPRAGADTLADVAEGLHAGLRDGRGGAAAGGDLEDGGLYADPPAADAYPPISVGELQSRVEGDVAFPGPAEEPSGDASEPPYDRQGREDETLAGETEPDGADPESSGPADARGGEDDDGEFALTPEEGYDFGLEDEAEPEDPAGEIFGRGAADQARRLPVALVAAIGVAVAVTAFVIGLGWMGAGADDDAAAAEEAGASVADGPGRAFSEGVVDEAEPAAAAPEPAATPPRGASPAAAAASGVDRPAAAAPVRRPEPVASPAPETPAPPRAPAPPDPAAGDGRLLVRSMPPGAAVIVNGQSRGTTPLALAELPYGPYEVEVTLAGYGSRREQLVLDADDPIGSLNADLTADPTRPAAGLAPGPPPAAEVGIGSILAETRPPGAAVWLDQRFVGETPMSIPDVPAGGHRIEFRLDGYRTWTTTVEVVPATQARVAASLDDAAR